MRLNEEIRDKEVRLIDEAGEQLGIVLRQDALDKAREVSLDLVEIVPNAKPPVCKIMDYGKHLFQLSKKQTASKKRQKRVQIKKLRIRPMIEKGDYEVKLRSLKRFLEEGNKVEVSLRFKGRELAHRELGAEVLNRIQTDLIDVADVEHKSSLQERQMMILLVPKKK